MEKTLIPILVRSPGGRCGTSLIMELIGTSDEVSFDRSHPYEVRMLSYFYRMSRMIIQDKKIGLKWENDFLVRGPQDMMGPFPIKSSLIKDYKEFSNNFLISSWVVFSEEVRNSFPHTKYYAEKIPHDILDDISSIFESKTIYLIRDPRDELTSILKFNVKRNSYFFGYRENDTIESFSRRFIQQRMKYFNLISNRSSDKNSIVIKYEDMVRNLDMTSVILSKFIGTKFFFKKVKGSQQHMTSSTPEKSIGKFEYFLESKIIDEINSKLENPLKEFGYMT